MTFRKHPIWLWPNVLSLDAPVIAMLWQAFFASSFYVPLIAPAQAALGSTVWALYLADRMLDARRITGPATPRHRFPREHPRVAAVLLVCALALAVVAMLQLRPVVMLDGVLLSAAVGVYFLSVHRWRPVLPKELLVAVLFACGTILAPWARSESKLAITIGGVAFLMVLLANTVAIETYEWRRVRLMQSETPPAATLWAASHYRALAGLIVLACIVGAAVAPAGLARTLTAVAIAMLLLAILCEINLSPDAFRVLADVALLAPIPVWALWPA
jgi:hypothetical protein